MKEGPEIIKSCKQRGYEFDGSTYWPPNSPQAERLRNQRVLASGKKKTRANGLKTGWIDDYRNIRNKEKSRDMFDQLVEQELGLEVWNEFYPFTDKGYRIDKAIPVAKDGKVLKLAIEIDGGIWAKGNSGHSSGKGILRDMDKGTRLATEGWILIRREPDRKIKTESQLTTSSTLELIKKAIESRG